MKNLHEHNDPNQPPNTPFKNERMKFVFIPNLSPFMLQGHDTYINRSMNNDQIDSSSEEDLSFVQIAREGSVDKDSHKYVNFLVENISIPVTDSFVDSNFSIVKKIGTGSFSKVYEVLDKSYNRFALKISNLVTNNTERMRYKGEINILAQLSSSEKFLKLFNAWEQDSHIYILTELCNYGNLKDRFSELPSMSKRDIFDMMQKMTCALNELHQKYKIVHMDIKPVNFLFRKPDDIIISDFGLSFHSECNVEVDCEGDKYYLAPEVLQGKPTFSSDIFALGITFYEVFTLSKLPDSGTEWQAIRSNDFTFLKIDNEFYYFYELIFKMLAQNPYDRIPLTLVNLELERFKSYFR